MKTKLLGILLLGIVCFTGCQSSHKAITVDEFQDITKKNNYYFSDVSEQFDDEKIERVVMASTTVWHVEYYVLDTVENAQDMFESNRISFKETMISTSYEKEKNTKNTKCYQLTTSYEFMYIYQVDNTLLFARVPVEYRSKVLKFIQDLDY